MKDTDRRNHMVWLLRIVIVALGLFQGYVLHKGNARIADDSAVGLQIQR